MPLPGLLRPGVGVSMDQWVKVTHAALTYIRTI
jgi:hypothetical protein